MSTDLTNRGVLFNFSYAPGTRQEVIDGFEKAGSLWSAQLADTYVDDKSFSDKSTQINIYINFAALADDSALGGARPGMVRVDYNKFLTAAFQDLTSIDDLIAFRSLQVQSNDKGFAEGVLAGFGINKYNTDLQNRQALTNLGLTARSDISIQNQSQALFNQLTPEKLTQLNRANVQFDSNQFNLLVSATNQVKFSFKEGQGLATTSGAVLDNNGSDNNKKIWLTRANAKALNLLKGDDTTFDGELTFSNAMLGAGDTITSFSTWLSSNPGSAWNANQSIWDFSRVYSNTAGVAANKFDFLSVATHEIGHILGFTSGTDAFSMINSVIAGSGLSPVDEKDIAYTAPMDLFRYSDTSKQLGVFDWSTTAGEKYFSIDGGKTRLADFAKGEGDDDYQGSHWANQPLNPLGIMNPTMNRGQILNISNLDLQLLDVIGWDRSTTSFLSNQKGLNLGTGAVGSQLSDKVSQIGLDWSNLNNLLTKPTAQLVTDLSQELAAISPYQQTALSTDLQTNQTQLKAEQDALKIQQGLVSTQLATAQKNLSTQQSTLSTLQKSVFDLQISLQVAQNKLLTAQTSLQTASASKQSSIQAQIASLQTQKSSLQSQLQGKQTQFSNQQQVVGDAQTQINNLQTQLAGLQTTLSIDALTAKVSDLQNKLKILNSLSSDGLKLSQTADSYTIKTKLDSLKSGLDLKLQNLTLVGDGSRRTQEQQKVLAQVVKMAQDQEKLWNQLVANYELALFSGVKAQVTGWLSETPAQLKVRMETATAHQLASLLQLADQDTSGQGWATKVQQATMLLAQVDAKTAEEAWRKAAKELPKLLENSGPDNPLSGSRTSSSSTAYRFWQMGNPNFLDPSAYSDQGAYVVGVENADLNMHFYSTNGESQNTPKILSLPHGDAPHSWQTGVGRAQEVQNIVEQVVKVALKQESLWNQPVTHHEWVLSSGLKSQVTNWLSNPSDNTPDPLKVSTKTTSPLQLKTFLQLTNPEQRIQGQGSVVKMKQITRLLAQGDTKTENKGGQQPAKELSKLAGDANLDNPFLVL
ncbi:MAG: NF038122 family metalloprotease [Kovacikia sp.]